jgi:hypothetical protein
MSDDCDHDWEHVGEEYDSLANGGSYDIYKCRKCGHRDYSMIAD